MLADRDTVHKLIPQDAPMIMVDKLIYQDDLRSVTGFYIVKENVFISNEWFSEEGMIENMAQSAALRSGWKAMKKAEDNTFKPEIGVLGAVKNFKLYQNPKADSHIITEIEIITEVFNATVIHGKVKQDECLLAEAELKIFVSG